MNADGRDRQALLDMLETIDRIERHVGSGRASLDDELTEAAILRWLGVLGEAAGRVSAQVRASHRHVPWRSIVGLRNLLVHAYDRIDLDRVWQAIEQLRSLRPQLDAICQGIRL